MRKNSLKRLDGMNAKREKLIANGTIKPNNHVDRYGDKPREKLDVVAGIDLLDQIRTEQAKERRDSRTFEISYERRVTVTERITVKTSPAEQFRDYKNDVKNTLDKLYDSINLRSKEDALDSIDRFKDLMQNPLVKKIDLQEKIIMDSSFDTLENLFLASRVVCLNEQYFDASFDIMYLKDLKDRKKEEMKKYFEEVSEAFNPK